MEDPPAVSIIQPIDDPQCLSQSTQEALEAPRPGEASEVQPAISWCAVTEGPPSVSWTSVVGRGGRFASFEEIP